MTHFIALKRNNLVRGTLEHITLASYLFVHSICSTTILEVTRIKNVTAWWRIETFGRMEDVHYNGGCTLKSPGRKIERQQYVVLIEKEVPNLVLADIVISACRIILIGGHGKDQLLSQVVEGRR